MALPKPGAIALRAVLDAIANIGVREQGGNNRGRFIAVYLAAVGLLVGNPWCLAFVMYRLQAAAKWLGLTLPADVPRTGYTPTFANWAKKKGYWISRAAAEANPWLVQKGDLVFFYWRVGKVVRIAHVGIVTGYLYKDGKIIGVTTVEGNTNGKGERDSTSGDGVWDKQRPFASLGSGGGFVRLPF